MDTVPSQLLYMQRNMDCRDQQINLRGYGSLQGSPDQPACAWKEAVTARHMEFDIGLKSLALSDNVYS